MAGNYPDVPSWRMAYDRDGTQVFITNGVAVLSQLTEAQVRDLNDEDATNDGVLMGRGQFTMVFIFPEKRDIDAVHLQDVGGRNQPTQVQVSTNTTNGIDGTWTTILSGAGEVLAGKPRMRTGIQSTTALAVKAVRVVLTSFFTDDLFLPVAHLYGEIAPGENPDRLVLWDAVNNERIDPAEFDWGNVPRASSADKTFRVKNNSATLTAHSIRVALETLTDTNPSVPGQHTLSVGGGSFLAQVNIGDLAPGAISPVITLRRITPTNATLSLWWLRVFAEADSWS